MCALASHLSGWADFGFHESGGVMSTNGLHLGSKGKEHLHNCRNKADFTCVESAGSSLVYVALDRTAIFYFLCCGAL